MKYVGTYSDPKDIVTKDKLEAVASRVSTNEDNIAMAESDIDGLQTDVGTLKTNVSSLQTALTNKQDVIVGAASTITENNLVADRALISNSSGKVAVSNVTSTELGYLDGVTSNVQTQLDKKLEKAPVTSVNNKTGAVQLNATDVGAISTGNISQTLGTSTTKVPSEKAVSDALSSVGTGDMLKSTYDPTGSVATAGGIPDYVEANGGKIDTIKVNGTAQTVSDKTVNITVPTKTSDITNDSGYLTSAPVTSVNSKTGAVELTADDVGAVSKTGDTMTGNLTVGSASLQTNGYVTGTWLKTTADTALSSTPAQIAVLFNGWIRSRTPSQIKSDIGLGNVDNVKQYSASNPPPYPVTSVNGQTGDVTVEADLPEHLVKYQSLTPVEATTLIDANTLQGHDAAYFAKQSDVSTINSQVSTNTSDISTLQSGLSTTNANIANKIDKSGGTMTGALVAQTNTNYATRQVRNIIISTADPSGGQSGDIWIKYSP